MTNKIIIFGSNGQVGQALLKLSPDNTIAVTREKADFSNPDQVRKFLDNTETPKAIINTAAYTAVDKAEEDYETAYKVNAETPFVIAEYCLKQDIPLIHYSTDYVFSGEGSTPWQEGAPPSPLNKYGESKLAGEKLITQSGCKHIIFRTSWVYDHVHKNFLTTMLKLGAEREELNIVDDQTGAPTYAAHLAAATLKTLENNFQSGIYHLCNSGITNWYNFAVEIFDKAEKAGLALKIKKVNPIPSSAYKTPAKRPLNSRLDCSKAKNLLGITMPSWQDGLTECIKMVK